MLCNNYQSRNLIGHYLFWVISPRNSTSFTRPFLARRHARAEYETKGRSAYAQLSPLYPSLYPYVTHVINYPRPSIAFPYYKRRKAGRGLGTRLGSTIQVHNLIGSYHVLGIGPRNLSSLQLDCFWPGSACRLGKSLLILYVGTFNLQ